MSVSPTMNGALSLPNMNRSCWQIVVNYANSWSVFELVLHEDVMNFMEALLPASYQGDIDDSFAKSRVVGA
jgi:hypothetical protein